MVARSPHRAWPFIGALAFCAGLRILLDSPQSESTALAMAILAALPWSLVLALLAPSPGFGEFAAWWVAAGISVNLLLVWSAFAWIARRWHRRGRTPG
jgi:hypothetical protein